MLKQKDKVIHNHALTHLPPLVGRQVRSATVLGGASLAEGILVRRPAALLCCAVDQVTPRQHTGQAGRGFGDQKIAVAYSPI
eukprot:scaffold32202_cov17-Tisochrysis_lutea.AAC.3